MRTVKQKAPKRIFPILLLAALVLGCGGPVPARGGTGDEGLDSWYERLASGAEPAAVAAGLPAESLTDLRLLNALRLRLKAVDKASTAKAFFAALATRARSDAVLLNLSLTYVDQMPGKSLLRQGYLSTRSQRVVEPIIERDIARDADHPSIHWTAWYIRGLNNLYWPDWFGKAPLAQEYLTEAVAIHRRLSATDLLDLPLPEPPRSARGRLSPARGEGPLRHLPVEGGERDMYALGYLALGDAYALQDKPAAARRAWTDGLRFYPYVTALRERLKMADDALHARVRDLRDADRPIDTDLAFMWSHRSAPFEVTLTGGILFGPGPLEDQPLHPGALMELYLGGALTGFIPASNNGPEEPNLPGEILQAKAVNGLPSVIPASNNGPEEPNLPGEILQAKAVNGLPSVIPASNNGPEEPDPPGEIPQAKAVKGLPSVIPASNNGPEEPDPPGEIPPGKAVDGLLSDGTEANENVDVGFVSLMNGRFNLFLAAIQDGPNAGKVDFFLDRGWHWTIRDDIAIDPGFPVGVVKFNEFVFSTGPRVLPFSRQTEAGAPAGVDRAGGLESGSVVPGALGDEDFDGRLDGTFNAIGRFPYESVILPGAPFAQTRVFKTDIPITSGQAALLTLANGLSHLRLAFDLEGQKPELATALRATARDRMGAAIRHAKRSYPDQVSDLEKQKLRETSRAHMDAAAQSWILSSGTVTARAQVDVDPPPTKEESLAEKTRAMIDLFGGADADMDQAALCAGWKLLQDMAPEHGLYRRDFDGSGVTVCSQDK